MDESSQFTHGQDRLDGMELVTSQGATCDGYRVKLYGKLHFLKRLKPQYSGDIRYREALRKEFETGYCLEHPNLVRYITLESDSILMEYVDGETLTQRLERQPEYFYNRKHTDKFIHQLLDVMGYLHSHQVLYLDLKPDNIMLTRIGDDLKLVDLGCCLTDTFVDTPGRTPAFAAPEQLPSDEEDFSQLPSDEKVSPQLPSHQKGSSQLPSHHRGGAGVGCDVRTDIYTIGRILQLLPHTRIYNNVLARCTADDKDARYNTVEELRTALRHRNIARRLCVVGTVVIILSTLILLLVLPYLKSSTVKTEQRQQSDTLVTTNIVIEPAPDTTAQSVVSAPPIAAASSPAPVDNSERSLKALKSDIRNTVLPMFQATMGLLADSVRPGSTEWAQAGWALQDSLKHTLEDIILRHQDIPMETIAKEYNDYLQSLITIKYNKAMSQ